jgi:DNA-binding transcriptional LysR family regulator
VELRQLRYFVAVAEERHFGRAAKRLRLSQPPLSTQIKGLEEELGVKLFQRSTRQVALTDAGRTFLERAEGILEAVEEAKEAAKGADEGVRGRLEIGFISSATLGLLPPAIRLFRERFGGVEIELRELTSAQQIDALYAGEIRVGLVRLPLRAPGLRFEPLQEESFLVALPSGHPLEALESVPLEAMVDQPLIFFTRQLMPSLHAQIVELFQRVGAFPNVVQHAVHLQTIVGLVASDVGLAILPEPAERFSREGVVYRSLDAPDATSWVGLARVEGDGSLLVENFVRTVREVSESEAHSETTIHRE